MVRYDGLQHVKLGRSTPSIETEAGKHLAVPLHYCSYHDPCDDQKEQFNDRDGKKHQGSSFQSENRNSYSPDAKQVTHALP